MSIDDYDFWGKKVSDNIVDYVDRYGELGDELYEEASKYVNSILIRLTTQARLDEANYIAKINYPEIYLQEKYKGIRGFIVDMVQERIKHLNEELAVGAEPVSKKSSSRLPKQP